MLPKRRRSGFGFDFGFRELNMRFGRYWRHIQALACGMVMLQAGGCTISEFNQLLQTIFLGITAAGAVAILNNV